MSIHEIIQSAAKCREADYELTKTQVWRSEYEGFKEANIVFDVLSAFRAAGWAIFPEFPTSGGSIDAVLCDQSNNLVVFESKRFYSGSKESIYSQTLRMMNKDVVGNIKSFFNQSKSVTSLWVCDMQDLDGYDSWREMFLKSDGWSSGQFEASKKYKYKWVYAIKTGDES